MSSPAIILKKATILKKRLFFILCRKNLCMLKTMPHVKNLQKIKTWIRSTDSNYLCYGINNRLDENFSSYFVNLYINTTPNSH